MQSDPPSLTPEQLQANLHEAEANLRKATLNLYRKLAPLLSGCGCILLFVAVSLWLIARHLVRGAYGPY